MPKFIRTQQHSSISAHSSCTAKRNADERSSPFIEAFRRVATRMAVHLANKTGVLGKDFFLALELIIIVFHLHITTVVTSSKDSMGSPLAIALALRGLLGSSWKLDMTLL